jgi:hypothetical protein
MFAKETAISSDIFFFGTQGGQLKSSPSPDGRLDYLPINREATNCGSQGSIKKNFYGLENSLSKSKLFSRSKLF